MKTGKLLIIALLLIMCLTGCGIMGGGSVLEKDATTVEIFAMDTVITIRCYGENAEVACGKAEQEIKRLEQLLSVTDKDSEISKINDQGEGNISEDTANIINEALRIYDITGGAFDITMLPVMKLWGFVDKSYKVPEAEELKVAVSQLGAEKIEWNNSEKKIKLAENQGLDLGGIAKGYASDKLMEIFKECNVTAGIVSLGGNVHLYGTRPDGDKWHCGITDPYFPDEPGQYLGVLAAADMAVVTSGTYERNFTEDGRKYHHIMNPETGYPVDNGIVSVTVISSSGMLSDALSTACFVMGLEKAVKFWQEYGDDFDMIIATKEGLLYVTEPINDAFESKYDVEVIKR